MSTRATTRYSLSFLATRCPSSVRRTDSADADVEVAVCTHSSGNLRYHGHNFSSGKGIQLAACQEAPNVYRAYNGDWYYRVVDGLDLASNSSVALYNGVSNEQWRHVLSAAPNERYVPSDLRSC